MRWLLFLSKLAFICGFCFLLSLALQLWNKSNIEAISSTVIIIGFVIGLIVVPLTLVCLPCCFNQTKEIAGSALAGDRKYNFPVYLNALYNFYQC